MKIPKTRRSPSRCREWERNRRNKFNDAISKLGETVKSFIEDNGDTQYPKVEIVEMAIVCLKTCNKEITELKAEILALQGTLDELKNRKNINKDASTQAHIDPPCE